MRFKDFTAKIEKKKIFSNNKTETVAYWTI